MNKTDVDRGEVAEVVEVVGVHVRRGDHLQYEERRGWEPLTEKYFIQSMDRYRERLRQPVFLMVTDDPVWVRREIAEYSTYSTGTSDQQLTNKRRNKSVITVICSTMVQWYIGSRWVIVLL